jgi:hypothetical protein
VELVDRYGTVKSFASVLASVIPWGATAAGSPVVAALEGLPKVMVARVPGQVRVCLPVEDAFDDGGGLGGARAEIPRRGVE